MLVFAAVISVACGDLLEEQETDLLDFATTTTTPDTYERYAERVRSGGGDPLERRDAEDRVRDVCLPDPARRLDIDDMDRLLMEEYCPGELFGR